MMIIRDHLIRHPDRCTHQAICVPICPTGRLALDSSLQVRSFPLPGKLSPLSGCLSLAGDLWGVQEGGEVAGAAKEVGRVCQGLSLPRLQSAQRLLCGAETFWNSLADSVSSSFPSPQSRRANFAPPAEVRAKEHSDTPL